MSEALRSRVRIGPFLLLVVGLLVGCTPAQAQPRGPSSANQSDPTATATTSPVVTPPASPTASATASATASPATAATQSAGVGGTTPTSRPVASSTPATTSTATTSTGSTAYNFPLLPPGATLPSEAFCAAHVQRSSWEPRPDNHTANNTVPTSAQIAALSPWDDSIGQDPRADQLRHQITGNFTGTTDEILQWVACKWGVPVNIVRAEAV
ncbi:MAG TPA: hypothetical protein VE338_18775, partial [Ktedonobacterales bacterium]|nr:hypothetical protein [Ktedonobacterales bacterium]